MKKSHNSSNATSSDHGRRDFLSLSLLAGSTFLLVTESHGHALLAQTDEVAALKEVSAADSLALYTNLLDEVRRLVLQRDAGVILHTKMDATDWLEENTSHAERLRSTLSEGATLNAQETAKLRSFLSDVISGGEEISHALIRMRQNALEEIRRLDTDIDNIRADLTAASNAIKNNNPEPAVQGIASAITKLQKYSTAEIERMSKALEREFQTSLITPARLQALLQTVRDSVGTGSAPPSGDLNHSAAYSRRSNYSSSIMVEPALQSGIKAVLRAKLKPSSWLQIGIGYAVTFPILLRVSDKNNRLKLLNDALRLVPPGLRNPLLAELASDLANLS